MRIAVVTNFLYPEALGGTELYCHQLTTSLARLGHEVYWVVPNFSEQETIEDYREKVCVVRFAAVDKSLESNAAFVAGSFIAEIKKRGIEIVHFNEFGGLVGISGFLLKETKKAGISTVVTLHLVHYVCHTGTLKYGGKEPCNGKVIPNRCFSCHLFSKATNSENANLLFTKIFNSIYNVVDKANLQVPRIKQVMEGFKDRQEFMRTLRESADAVVSLTNWFKEVLVINGVPEEKIIYLPQAAPLDNRTEQTGRVDQRKDYVFVGRVNKEKGVDMLLNIATKLKAEFPAVNIDLYGPYTPIDALAHTRIGNLEDFDNIRYKGVLKQEEVLAVMNQYKAVILPSRVAEMAPLIIMESNKLKVPVIASNVPGSVELVKQYDCGLIFKFGSEDDLYKKIKEIEQDVHRFTFIQPVENDFYHVAKKYEEVYATCIKQHDMNVVNFNKN